MNCQWIKTTESEALIAMTFLFVYFVFIITYHIMVTKYDIFICIVCARLVHSVANE